MNIKNIIAVLISALLLIGCGGYQTGVTSEAQQSYIFFNSPASGAEYSIDDSTWYKITSTGAKELYPVEPGKHRIKVRRNGTIIVDKTVLFGDSISKEIKVP